MFPEISGNQGLIVEGYNCRGKEDITISRITNITEFLIVRSPGIMSGHINISRNTLPLLPTPSQTASGQSENIVQIS